MVRWSLAVLFAFGIAASGFTADLQKVEKFVLDSTDSKTLSTDLVGGEENRLDELETVQVITAEERTAILKEIRKVDLVALFRDCIREAATDLYDDKLVTTVNDFTSSALGRQWDAFSQRPTRFWTRTLPRVLISRRSMPRKNSSSTTLRVGNKFMTLSV
jgi:hypothetical protein